MVYQPIVGRDVLEIVGFEALVRWNTREHGPISPAVFIPIAEEPNITHELGDWILGEALAVLRHRPHQYVPVDFSPRQFRRHNFVVHIMEAVQQARGVMRAELEVGREATAHVLEIIGQQQKRAHERAELERCDIAELVHKNAAFARYAQERPVAVAVPAGPHPVLASRVILSQVFGTLFGNAAEAIAAAGRDDGRIDIAVETVGDRVIVRISDNGEGFDPATAPKRFQRGFSTRRTNRAGWGCIGARIRWGDGRVAGVGERRARAWGDGGADVEGVVAG